MTDPRITRAAAARIYEYRDVNYVLRRVEIRPCCEYGCELCLSSHELGNDYEPWFDREH